MILTPSLYHVYALSQSVNEDAMDRQDLVQVQHYASKIKQILDKYVRPTSQYTQSNLSVPTRPRRSRRFTDEKEEIFEPLESQEPQEVQEPQIQLKRNKGLLKTYALPTKVKFVQLEDVPEFEEYDALYHQLYPKRLFPGRIERRIQFEELFLYLYAQVCGNTRMSNFIKTSKYLAFLESRAHLVLGASETEKLKQVAFHKCKDIIQSR